MRGAALKIGQMLSIQDNELIDPQVQEIMKRVQNQANYMPGYQLEEVMSKELGSNWRELFEEFCDTPIAAASIGQVHRAVYQGNDVAVKVQYPGVRDSIDSDLNNMVMLLSLGDLLPKGLYLDNTIRVARSELKMECDYIREADAMIKFQSLLNSKGMDTHFHVPKVYKDVSSQNVLVTEFVRGHTIDLAVNYSQKIRDHLGEQLLRLCLYELFVFEFMQTDPNWSNFLYSPHTNKIYLLDFGAAKEFPKTFLDGYIELLKSGAEQNREKAIEWSRKLGFLTGYESQVQQN
jgi:aarF domain-containing kinase